MTPPGVEISRNVTMACYCAASMASSFGFLLACHQTQWPYFLAIVACSCAAMYPHMWECWAPQVESCGFSCTPSTAQYVTGVVCQQHHMVGGGVGHWSTTMTSKSCRPARKHADALIFSIDCCPFLHQDALHSRMQEDTARMATCNLKQSKPMWSELLWTNHRHVQALRSQSANHYK